MSMTKTRQYPKWRETLYRRDAPRADRIESIGPTTSLFRPPLPPSSTLGPREEANLRTKTEMFSWRVCWLLQFLTARIEKALFRVQHHARTTLPGLVETRVELDRVRRRVGDTDVDAAREISRRLRGRVEARGTKNVGLDIKSQQGGKVDGSLGGEAERRAREIAEERVAVETRLGGAGGGRDDVEEEDCNGVAKMHDRLEAPMLKGGTDRHFDGIIEALQSSIKTMALLEVQRKLDPTRFGSGVSTGGGGGGGGGGEERRDNRLERGMTRVLGRRKGAGERKEPQSREALRKISDTLHSDNEMSGVGCCSPGRRRKAKLTSPSMWKMRRTIKKTIGTTVAAGRNTIRRKSKSEEIEKVLKGMRS